MIEPIEMSEILESDNIAELIPAQDLKKLSNKLCGKIQSDEESMAKYRRRADEVMKLASMEGEEKDKTFPFSGASNIRLPYLFEASVDFNSRFMSEINKKNLVKVASFGKGNDGKDARISRVADACNFVINHDLDGREANWRNDTDRAIMYLSIIGQFFRKNYQSDVTNKQESEVIFGEDMIYNHEDESFYKAPRKSFEFTRTLNEVVTAIRSGEFVDSIDIEKKKEQEVEELEFYECHCDWDLDGDYYEEPYIFFIEKEKGEIVHISRRFDEQDIERNEDGEIVSIEGEQMFTQYGFIPDPNSERRAVYIGWGMVFYDLMDSINTNANQLIDAGTIQNISSNSGFIDKSVRVKKGKAELIMGQFTQLDSGSTSRPLRDAIYQAPFAGPSKALYDLMMSLKDDAKAAIMAAHNLEGNPNEAAELYLSRLQQALKTPNSISARIYRAMSHEFNKIFDLVGRYMTPERYNQILDEDQSAQVRIDFNRDDLDIMPVANPNFGSEEEKIQKQTIVYNEAKTSPPGLYNTKSAAIDYLSALGIEEPEKYIDIPQEGEEDQFAQMQAQYAQMQQQIELERVKSERMRSEAAMLSAQANVSKARGDAKKVNPEIQEIISKAIKNISDAKLNDSQTLINPLKQRLEEVKALENHQRSIRDMAQRPTN